MIIGFTKNQLAILKAMGFEVQDDTLCNKDKGTITALAKNYGTSYCYHGWGQLREYFWDFERLVQKIS